MLKSQAGMEIRRLMTEQQRLAGSQMSMKAEEIREATEPSIKALFETMQAEGLDMSEAVDAYNRLWEIVKQTAK
jgi:predicted transcriptional regulator